MSIVNPVAWWTGHVGHVSDMAVLLEKKYGVLLFFFSEVIYKCSLLLGKLGVNCSGI